MTIRLHDKSFKHIANPNVVTTRSLSQTALDSKACEMTAREIESWPEYQPTPLISLNNLAKSIGIELIWYKDEGLRFGLKSFKALGGAFAVSQILINEINLKLNQQATIEDLIARRFVDITEKITVTCATDGNHGRSVAWGADKFGCQSIIYIHATVSEERQQAIEAFGANVVRTDSNYDGSVRQAAQDAKVHGRVVVSDTSYPGYMDIPKFVMQGYTVIAEEIFTQLPQSQMPTHVFLQGGVGSFASAITARIWQTMQENRPRIVIAEPDQAACIFESIKAGHPVAIDGELDTLMAGLACGEVSLLAWDILKPGIDDVLIVSDNSARKCMKLLADDNDTPVVAGESAVAGLAGLLCALEDNKIATRLGLDQHSRVLIIGTEGATDEQVYHEIVGRGSDEVCAR